MDKFIKLFFDGAKITGLGMLAVIAIIAIIYFVIKGIGKAAGSGTKPAKAEAPKEEAKKEPEPEPAQAAEEPAGSDDLELIAVLAAAISAYSGEPITKFRVVSFKHIK